jgi:8-oxo-dGTP pyrophosphatase MutT (NUDIX family)
MRQATLCYILDSEKVLLGLKKRGFGEGLWNGFGGKVMPDESIEEATAREVLEESEVKVKNLEKVGEITFFFENKDEWNQVVHVFLAKDWSGEVIESEEMKPEWFHTKKLPKNMWADDPHWLPLVLEQGKKVKGTFHFTEDGSGIIKHELETVEKFLK